MNRATGVRPYQRRRARPAVVLTLLLAALTVVTWTIVLANGTSRSTAPACNAPAGGKSAGQVVDVDELAAAQPVAAGAVKIRALNAGGQRGRANLVASQLGDLGFSEAAPPANDPLYPEADLACRGQIRFGPAGVGPARTLSLVLPCTELVRDARPDDTVDLAVGNDFRDVNPSKAVRDVLDQLANVSASPDSGASGPAGAAPDVDPQLLTRAAQTNC